MEELCQPILNGQGGPISPISIQATNFRLKNAMIQQVQNSCQFYGLSGEDANKHLDKFLHVTQSIKVNGITDDALHLYLFPQSLTHHATAWFNRLPRNSITIFEQMAKMFLGKYFPPSMVTKLRNEITNFRQRPDEHRGTINAAVGGTFMKRRPEECYDLIENMTTHHNDWDTSAQRKINRNLMKVLQINKQVKAVTPSCETYGGPHSYNDCPATVSQTQNVYAAGAYNQVEAPVSALKPNPKPSIPYPSRLNGQKLREKTNDQMEKFFQIFQDLNFNISFTDALILMPNGPPQKVTRKAGGPWQISHAYLGASINLMPLSIWNKLSLPALSPTCMTLELADRSISRSIRVTKDVCVKVGKFHFPIDFVVVDFDADPRVPLILVRSFLKTKRALIDVYEGELTLRVGNKAVTFNLDQTSRYSANYDDESIN
nr:reverse transcriptase domain-containing protein [Tanacetum cinerariifolium]